MSTTFKPSPAITLADLFPWSVNTPAEAVCADGYDPELWYPHPTTEASTATALCSICPIRLQCLEAALERGEPDGIWGGVLFRNGRQVDPATQPGMVPSPAWGTVLEAHASKAQESEPVVTVEPELISA